MLVQERFEACIVVFGWPTVYFFFEYSSEKVLSEGHFEYLTLMLLVCYLILSKLADKYQ